MLLFLGQDLANVGFRRTELACAGDSNVQIMRLGLEHQHMMFGALNSSRDKFSNSQQIAKLVGKHGKV